jgi:hypothetical protein
MDRQKVAARVASDGDELQEFIDALRDCALSVERDIAGLRGAAAQPEVVGSLFRSLHNIKGDAAMCRIDLAVDIVHPIETMLGRVRNDALPFSPAVADVVLLAVDRLELAMARLSCGESLDGLELAPLIHGLEKLALAVAADADACAVNVIEAVTGFRSAVALSPARCDRGSALRSAPQSRAAQDLRFFRRLADQFEARSPLFEGRTLRILGLALQTNQVAGEIIDPQQLEAAVYMHDVGMMFLAESVWLKAGKMSSAEKLLLRTHPDHAAGLLSRMAGWSAAAEMVQQHHETPDGKGYPAGLVAAQIGAGAKLLAMVDAFEAVMLKQGHSGRKRSVLRAIAEINACDQQFVPEWIGPFNQVIRRSLEMP